MSDFLNANEYVMGCVDSYERTSGQSFLCTYKKQTIELIGIKSGCTSIISVLGRSERYRRVIGLGFFVGITPSVNIGDILIPSKSIPLPGVPSSVGFPDKNLARILTQECKKLGTTVTGLLATSPQVIKRMTKQVETLSNQGVLGIDMETSCFLSILNHKPTPSAALLICSDHITVKPLPLTRPNKDTNLPLDTQTATIAKKAVLLAIRTLRQQI
jgi:purine-nucleoside phosphorylase